MTFISYAQNFEDVMLWRALKHIDNGFYIDVGANHPRVDSVTKAFYDHGWCGINIEPEKELYDLLVVDRKKDLNLNIAISSSVKTIDFFVSSTRGWSTTDEESKGNLQDKGALSEVLEVQAVSLDKLCEQHRVNEVHFLKVDVEGAEKDVLESFSFDEVRPWIVVVEATKPTTQIDVSVEWESILFENDYLFAYFDGLNKFYVANEHSELVDVLKLPPNVFDEFILSQHRDSILNMNKAEAKASEAEAKAGKAEAKAGKAEAKASEAEAKASEAEAKVIELREASAKIELSYMTKLNEAILQRDLILNSTSWKLLKPCRFCVTQSRLLAAKVMTPSAKSRIKLAVRDLFFSARYNLEKHPRIKKKAMDFLSNFPYIKERLINVVDGKKLVVNAEDKPLDSFAMRIKKEVESRKKLKGGVNEK
ncbi:FkbM family methyltransferase [Vibrio parahaemolyticus]